ncbi:hypothetical protein PLUTE_a0813 [Pseudoalteromonas luteoviolacea DSM 6061]|nr:hypothetical protein [Pseudoalteromonas luteoviolacea DSM 6061]
MELGIARLGAYLPRVATSLVFLGHDPVVYDKYKAHEKFALLLLCPIQ